MANSPISETERAACHRVLVAGGAPAARRAIATAAAITGTDTAARSVTLGRDSIRCRRMMKTTELSAQLLAEASTLPIGPKIQVKMNFRVILSTTHTTTYVVSISTRPTPLHKEVPAPVSTTAVILPARRMKSRGPTWGTGLPTHTTG